MKWYRWPESLGGGEYPANGVFNRQSNLVAFERSGLGRFDIEANQLTEVEPPPPPLEPAAIGYYLASDGRDSSVFEKRADGLWVTCRTGPIAWHELNDLVPRLTLQRLVVADPAAGGAS